MIRTVTTYTDDKVYLEEEEVLGISQYLRPGIYEVEVDEYGRFKNLSGIKLPTVFSLIPSDQLKNMQDFVKIFLSPEYIDLCKKSHTLRKSGLLLYGAPGIGKSNYVNSIIKECIENSNACVFNITSAHKLSILIPKLRDLRNIQDTLFVVVLEEIDELFTEKWTEALLKNFMDGINSIENCLFIGTTNYIELIPKSLTERPSRFKKVLQIKPSTDSDQMKAWLSITYRCFIPDLSDEDCEMLHDKCINRPIDEIKHIIMDHKLGIRDIAKERSLGFKR